MDTNTFARAVAAFTAQGGNLEQLQAFISSIGQDRLVRKEVALGIIREIVPPQDHIGLSIVPWLEVASDDVVFDFAKGFTDGLAPARAEDAESELARKDDIFPGQGRASILDWALKNHYTASDISRYREWLRIAELVRDTQSLPLTVTSATEDWQAKLARDTARRRRMLDNRIELLIMDGLSTGVIAYNDGKIKFSVDFGRPAAQQPSNAANDITGFVVDGVADWTTTTFDPIGLFLAVQDKMWSLYAVHIDRVIASRRLMNRVFSTDKFAQRSGLIVPKTSGDGIISADPNYVMDGWGPRAAVEVVQNATGITFVEYDSVYRTRPLGSQTVTANRFHPELQLTFLPSEADLAQFDDTDLGFGKVLTSPHPEGNWAAGFYEWEKDDMDPWGYDVGTGVKAFPVLPHMDKTYALTVNAP